MSRRIKRASLIEQSSSLYGLPAIHHTHLTPQHLIQHLRDRPGDWVEEEYEQLDDPDGMGPDSQAMPGAYGLRQDLPQEKNESGGCQEADQAVGDPGHGYG